MDWLTLPHRISRQLLHHLQLLRYLVRCQSILDAYPSLPIACCLCQCWPALDQARSRPTLFDPIARLLCRLRLLRRPVACPQSASVYDLTGERVSSQRKQFPLNLQRAHFLSTCLNDIGTFPPLDEIAWPCCPHL